KSDNLPAYLAELKTDKSAIVVYRELDFEMIVSFLGASKAGFSYIPSDAHTPKERIELILNVAKPTAVIAVHEWPELATEVPVITPEELTEMMMHAP
ncbi:AMP-binding protein, partial [Enterococcus faecalis]|uniref:AMP-binding protein n=1 Tax=Enterococcus faecalis TaxID=1351 RepID=UPI003CC54897